MSGRGRGRPRGTRGGRGRGETRGRGHGNGEAPSPAPAPRRGRGRPPRRGVQNIRGQHGGSVSEETESSASKRPRIDDHDSEDDDSNCFINNNNNPTPGCSHWGQSDRPLSTVSNDQRIGDSDDSDPESDPDDDPGDIDGDLAENELPDIEDVPDESDEEYDIPVRLRKDRLVKDLFSAMEPNNYNR